MLSVLWTAHSAHAVINPDMRRFTAGPDSPMMLDDSRRG